MIRPGDALVRISVLPNNYMISAMKKALLAKFNEIYFFI